MAIVLPLPVVERIAETIVVRQRACTRANGYNVDVVDVVRPTRVTSDQRPDNNSVMLSMGDPELDEENSTTQGLTRLLAVTQPFFLTYFVVPSDLDESPVDTRINQLVSAGRKALTAPVNWQQFADGADAAAGEDHLAIDSIVMPGAFIEDHDGSFDGFVIEYRVTYRTPEDNPYIVG